jgi:hypothetical protein
MCAKKPSYVARKDINDVCARMCVIVCKNKHERICSEDFGMLGTHKNDLTAQFCSQNIYVHQQSYLDVSTTWKSHLRVRNVEILGVHFT